MVNKEAVLRLATDGLYVSDLLNAAALYAEASQVIGVSNNKQYDIMCIAALLYKLGVQDGKRAERAKRKGRCAK